jgi:phosphoribosylformylglycinamidine synthase
LDGPIGGAAYNKFGRPNLAGYFRSFGSPWAVKCAATTSPSCSRQLRQHRRHAQKPLGKGTLFIHLGGPGFLIGMGGGGPSMASGRLESLDFDSVQRASAGSSAVARK